MNYLLALLAALALATAPVGEKPAGDPKADALFEEGFELLFGPQADAESQKAALKPLEDAAARGHSSALNTLGVMYLHGLGVTADPVRALAYLERAVAAGDRGAFYNLGAQLAMGDDEAQYPRAAELLQHAYEDPDFQYRAGEALAVLYLFGKGVGQDVPRGVTLLLEADGKVEANPNTLFLLGRAYESGWGDTAPDAAKSLRYFERAAEVGHPQAAWKAGMIYLQGETVPRDEKRAADLVRKAAEGGDLNGFVSRAVMLATGEGVEEDDVAARDWYAKAVDQGSAHGLRGLGGMLLNGEGGPVDRISGFAYLELAADGGDEYARRAMDALGGEITAEEREAIAVIKAAWLAKHGPPRGDGE